MLIKMAKPSTLVWATNSSQLLWLCCLQRVRPWAYVAGKRRETWVTGKLTERCSMCFSCLGGPATRDSRHSKEELVGG